MDRNWVPVDGGGCHGTCPRGHYSDTYGALMGRGKKPMSSSRVEGG